MYSEPSLQSLSLSPQLFIPPFCQYLTVRWQKVAWSRAGKTERACATNDSCAWANANALLSVLWTVAFKEWMHITLCNSHCEPEELLWESRMYCSHLSRMVKPHWVPLEPLWTTVTLLHHLLLGARVLNLNSIVLSASITQSHFIFCCLESPHGWNAGAEVPLLGPCSD